MQLNAKHYTSLVSSIHGESDWSGQNPRQWASFIIGKDHDLISWLPNNSQSRQQLHDYCADACNSVEACFLAVMAWGGMRRDHGRTAWRALNSTHKQLWKTLAVMRTEKSLSREEVYDILNKANIKGLGPAYFTKLMFFFSPLKNCYILDQWTARSASLLLDKDNFPIRMHLGKTVMRNNPATLYEIFCQLIEGLAQDASFKGLRPDQIEECLFGGRNSEWRHYVKQNG